MDIQWYPGHMTKAKRIMLEDIKLIDVVVEILDSRVPLSSRNPDIDEMAKNKFRVLLLNKEDLADPAVLSEWKKFYEDKGMYVKTINSKEPSKVKQVNTVIMEACKEKIERDRKRGIVNRPIRAMIAGIPNVGKSTFINAYTGKASTKTGNKPGVTKGKQWIKSGKNIELLDTPGILWPKFEDKQTGIKLALIGTINDDILNKTELALILIDMLKNDYPQRFEDIFSGEKENVLSQKSTNSNDETDSDVTDNDETDRDESDRDRSPCDESGMKENVRVLEAFALKRGCLKKGNELDIELAARQLLDDFKNGRLGRLCLEKPPV